MGTQSGHHQKLFNAASHSQIVYYTSIYLTFPPRTISNLSLNQCQVCWLQARPVGVFKYGLKGADITHAHGSMATASTKKLCGLRCRLPSRSLPSFQLSTQAKQCHHEVQSKVCSPIHVAFLVRSRSLRSLLTRRRHAIWPSRVSRSSSGLCILISRLPPSPCSSRYHALRSRGLWLQRCGTSRCSWECRPLVLPCAVLLSSG